MPAVMQAFDRFIADSMSGLDLMYGIADVRSAPVGRRDRSVASVHR
jgi:hypothetical protein